MTIRTYQAVQAGLAARAASSGTDVAAVASAGGDGRPRRAA